MEPGTNELTVIGSGFLSFLFSHHLRADWMSKANENFQFFACGSFGDFLTMFNLITATVLTCRCMHVDKEEGFLCTKKTLLNEMHMVLYIL